MSGEHRSHGSGRSRRRSNRGALAVAWVAGAALLTAAVWAAFRDPAPTSAVAPPALDPVASMAPPSPTGCTSGRSIFAGPDGVAGNNGTYDNPLDLSTALSSRSPARPCDTVWLRGGTYAGSFVSQLTGREGAPILVRQVPGERATIDSAGSPDPALHVRGNWSWFMDFEVANSDLRRTSGEATAWPSDLRRGTGVLAAGSHLKFINLVVHDLTRGFEVGSAALDTEVYGSIIYYNGWEAPNGKSNGHGIDTYNKVGVRRLTDNIVFSQYSHGVIANSNEVSNLVLEGNILFNNGSLSRDVSGRDLLIGGPSIVEKPVLRYNVSFGPTPVVVGQGTGCAGAVIENNDFAGASVDVTKCEATVSGNTITNPAPALAASHPNNVYQNGSPTGVVVRVRPNQYEPGRANIAILNWDKAAEVDVDLTGIGLRSDTRFEIRDVQDFFGAPIATGLVGPQRVKVKMQAASRVTAPAGEGLKTPAHTSPVFAALVVVPLRASLATSTR